MGEGDGRIAPLLANYYATVPTSQWRIANIVHGTVVQSWKHDSEGRAGSSAGRKGPKKGAGQLALYR